MHGGRERGNGRTGNFPTKPINKKVGKVGGVIYIYEKGAEEKAREDNNDCGYDDDASEFFEL